MSNILLVTSSPRGQASHSSRLAGELAESLQRSRPGSRVVRRDLAAQPLPHIDGHFAGGIGTPEAERSEAQQRAVAASDAAVDELLAADTLVIAAGIINFGVPSTLKAWLDNVARAGRTFRYGEAGPEGLAGGRKAYLVVASGGVYSEGPAAPLDHAVPYLKTILGFIGITDVEVIRIEGVALGPEAEQAALTRAADALSALAVAA
ncbi:MAG TPA: FMN-dependent NADH-azoreductase [Alphaproteobacteria bacterium]|nr:FMN-dependent NADH-azoreductase [Alphaproteobacteria bacterium]